MPDADADAGAGCADGSDKRTIVEGLQYQTHRFGNVNVKSNQSSKIYSHDMIRSHSREVARRKLSRAR
jgi:hypothetical protein